MKYEDLVRTKVEWTRDHNGFYDRVTIPNPLTRERTFCEKVSKFFGWPVPITYWGLSKSESYIEHNNNTIKLVFWNDGVCKSDYILIIKTYKYLTEKAIYKRFNKFMKKPNLLRVLPKLNLGDLKCTSSFAKQRLPGRANSMTRDDLFQKAYVEYKDDVGTEIKIKRGFIDMQVASNWSMDMRNTDIKEILYNLYITYGFNGKIL